MNFLKRTWAEIDLNALIHNFQIFKTETNGGKIMAVVKANAYGHTTDIVAPVLQQNGADYFAVSNIEEAVILRKTGIVKPILILGYTPITEVFTLYQNNLSQCVYSKDYANELSDFAKKNNVKIKIHIKIDTGMSRLGFDCRDDSMNGIDDAILSSQLGGFILEGMFTHFCVADRTPDNEDGFTDAQYNRFLRAIKAFEDNGIKPELCHCCNSAGTLLDNDKHLNLCRAGISIYGLLPDSNLKLEQNLIPVMTLKSVVSMVKKIKKGDTVSYGRTFKADKKMTIATVTAGYADGYPRLLSNKGYVLINGKKANIVGRICMDQFCVDVSDIENVKIGDEVILFGKDLSVDIIANLCGTINYEIVCGISQRVPRIIKNG